MKSFKPYYLILFKLLIVAGLQGCGPDKDPPKPEPTDTTGTKPVVAKGKLRFHIHHYIGESELDYYDAVNTTEDGRKLNVTLAQLYISNIQLEKTDGTFYTIPGQIVFKVLENDTYEGGDVPAGNYKGIRFNVGLSPTQNKTVPTTNSTDVLNKMEMWFGATAQPEGYKFFNLKGKIDTTAGMTSLDNALVPFEYSIGTDKSFIPVIMPPFRYAIMPDEVEFLHFKIDLSRIFDGINLSDINNLNIKTPADNNKAVADKIRANIPSAFVYEF